MPWSRCADTVKAGGRRPIAVGEKYWVMLITFSLVMSRRLASAMPLSTLWQSELAKGHGLAQ